MKVRSVSPTALLTASMCTSRWYAENVIGGRGFSTPAADLGTACHSALEWYVKTAVIEGKQPQTEKTLLEFFQMFYLKVFKDHDFELPQYEAGVQMMRTWHKRNRSWDKFEVVSLEQKRSVTVDTPAGSIPCNFIIDRLDRLDEKTMRVVDYKTWRNKLYPEDVKRTIQGRVYALAVKVMYPEVERVLVTYDQLRYNEVGVFFELKDLEEAWRWLNKRVRYLLDLEEADIKETVNPQCGFCVKKNNCGAFRKHIEAGGILGKTDAQLLERLADLKNASAMITSAMTEIEEAITQRAEDDEDGELYHTRMDGTELEAKIAPRYGSFVVEEEVLALVGQEVYLRHATIGTAGHKRMLDDPELTPEQVIALKSLKKRSAKEPALNFKEKKG